MDLKMLSKLQLAIKPSVGGFFFPILWAQEKCNTLSGRALPLPTMGTSYPKGLSS